METTSPIAHRLRSRWLLAAAVISLTSGPSTATSLGGAVSIGPQKVDESKLIQAVAECSLNAPEFTRTKCVDTFWVPRWLLDAEANDAKLRDTPGMQRMASRLLYQGLDKKLRQSAAAPSETEVDHYLKQHRRDLEKPLRLRLFRILFNSKNDAETAIASLNSDATLEDFRKLARKSSVDLATHQRGGDLGFVWPDGSTDLPQVHVEPELYQAAQKLKDGEIARTPIPEGERFALLWRRGSKAAIQPGPETRKLVVQRIMEAQHEARLQSLLAGLKKKYLSKRNDTLLGKLRRPDALLFVEP